MKRAHYLFLSLFCLMLAGSLWGVRERVHQNPKVFHELFPKAEIEPISFFGKEMWKMKYKPESRVVRQLVQWVPINDFWHSSWYVIKILYVFGFWLAWKSGTWFWDFRKWHTHLIWFMVVTTFWGGVSFWGIGQLT